MATAGGRIALSSYTGLYLDGTLQALSGGTGALGGTLTLTMDSPIYEVSNSFTLTDAGRAARVITIDADTSSGSGLSASLTPATADPALAGRQYGG